MDLAQLQTRLGQLGVRPKDPYRAALYIDHLDAAQTYFRTTLANNDPPNGLRNHGYSFVAAALRSTSLLQELADILDFYIAPAVKGDLNRAYTQLGHGGPTGWTYADYFTNQILNANFDANVQTFRNMYPISTHALERLSANFQANIFLACQRIIEDPDRLTEFYQDLYEEDFTILSLQKIKSTGSDFHKGGKQVLILTFQIVHTVNYPTGPIIAAPIRQLLKVVYKPSDLEPDCLIAGNSAVVNRVLSINFMTESLFEIYNRHLQIIKAGNANFTGEPLTTYRILPRNYLSLHNGGYPLPIREAYGYIEYLDYDLSGTAQQVYGYYPFGASDYLIFQSQDRAAIVRSFYRREGALSALCGSFSIIDMHVENVRVMKYQPYLIDLEVSLTWSIDNIDKTDLLTTDLLNPDVSGITGISIYVDDLGWQVRDENTRGGASLRQRGEDVHYQNRLWSAAARRQKEVVDISSQYLLEGFTDGMTVLQAGQLNNDFAPWFARLNNANNRVVVRVLPFGTKTFKEIRDAIFITNGEIPNAALNATQEAELRKVLTQEYNKFDQAHDPAANPGFVSLTQTMAGPDYLNLDIPVFYHRIGTTEIVNSNGAQVPIGPTVTINTAGVNPIPPTHPADVTPPNGVLNRTTYYAAAPTQTIVDQGQVQILGGGGFGARVNLLRGTILPCLGSRDNALNQPVKIVPLDN